MPNFEKLIKQQQFNSNDRLRVVERNAVTSTQNQTYRPNFAGTQAFFGALFGSIIGSITVLTAIEYGFLKIESIINFVN